MARLLYGVKPADLLTLVVVSLILTGVAVLASYIPARRARAIAITGFPSPRGEGGPRPTLSPVGAGRVRGPVG
ncbi:MAG: hypothetical protein ACRD3O_02800 [Terriglobia bacterium]